MKDSLDSILTKQLNQISGSASTYILAEESRLFDRLSIQQTPLERPPSRSQNAAWTGRRIRIGNIVEVKVFDHELSDGGVDRLQF